MPTLVVFITLALTLAIILTVIVLIPWLNANKTSANNQLISLNVEIFQERLEELHKDYEAAVIGETEYKVQKTELERQLLQASDDITINTDNKVLHDSTVEHEQNVLVVDESKSEVEVNDEVDTPTTSDLKASPVATRQLVTRQLVTRQHSLVMLAWLPVLMGICYVLFSEVRTVSALWQWQDSMGQVADDLLTGNIDAPPNWASENDLALLNVIQTNVYRNAEDADRWLRLSDIFMVYQAPVKSIEAMSRAYRLNPNDENIALSYAQLQIFANNGVLNPEGRSALETVLSQNPNHQRAQMFMLMGEVGAGNYEQAKYWLAKLRAQLESNDGEPNAAVVSLDELSEQIAVWEQELQTNQAQDAISDEPVMGQELPAMQDMIPVAVSVKINPSLLPLIEESDLLFVTVSEETGGAPLAAQRIPADSLLKANANGLQIELSDKDAMMPNRTISNALTQGKALVVTARVSKSGQAITQSGDLAAVPVPLSENLDPVNIIIDKQIP